jgi:serine/threonine-protein kinase
VASDDPTRTVKEQATGRPTVRSAPPSDFGERFSIVRKLGEGGMGLVYEVIDHELEEHVALKALFGPELPGDAVARLKAEVRLARRVTHRNVVRIYDVGQHAASHFFTMELVPGGTLKHRLAAGPLPHGEALDIATQIARGLEAAHAAGVMHRDLKPSNVLLAPDGRAVVSDFGLARVPGALVAGEVSGTPEYMAPEQHRGQDSDPRVDVYAFGAIMHELTTSPPLLTLAGECRRFAPGDRPTSAELVRALEALSSSARATPSPALRPGEISALSQTLAVMPPRRLGDFDADLAHAFVSEMVDALARIRGLRVLGPSMTQAFESLTDPRRIADALGATALVETVLQLKDGRLRVGARLVGAADGRQLFSERFEDELGYGLQLLETLSTRVAESLRIGIDAVANHGSAPADALELYLRGRDLLDRERIFGADGAIETLEASLARAPDFAPALAAAAMAHIRAWFAGTATAGAMERARGAVERSDRGVPVLPEALLARGQLHRADGEPAAAVACFLRALSAAPSLALAHEWLSEIEMESGRIDDGIRRARYAIELDPRMALAHANLVARLSFLPDPEPMQALLRQAQARGIADAAPLIGTQLRVALRSRDFERAEALSHSKSLAGQLHQAFQHQLRIAQGEAGELLRAPPQAPLLRATLMLQLGIEASAVAERWDLAFGALDELAEMPFVDADWLARCPVFAPVRGERRYLAALEKVSARAAAIWASEGPVTKAARSPASPAANR